MDDEYAPITTAAFSAAAMLALVMALFSGRATLVESFVGKQRHVMAFFLLNVVLLAILFTSRDPSTISGNNGRHKKAEKKRKMERRPRAKPYKARCEGNVGEKEGFACELSDEELNERGEKEGFACELSDEELNERVESFIAAFRQHLVLDGRRR